jgi:signal transduction histidine kinase
MNPEELIVNEEVPAEEYSTETETMPGLQPEPAEAAAELPEEEEEMQVSKTDVTAHREPFYYLPELSDFLINNLRAQVHSITNTISVMKKNPSASDEFKKTADIIIKQAHLLPILLESGFDFALDIRNLTLSPVRISDTLNDVLLILSEYVEARKVKLYKKFEADAEVEIDKQKFFQVCFQVARNACDAMPGGGNLYVTLRKDNNNFRIEFRDEGPGVPISIREEIFEPYFSHGKPEGIGIGLTIANKIINDHGGSVLIEGELGEGTSVIISLPSGA